MTVWLSLWWVWMAIALALALAEVLLPGFIFLGFALAGVFMAIVVSLLPDLSTAALLAAYSVMALLCWIGLRLVFSKQSSQPRVFTQDVNDD